VRRQEASLLFRRLIMATYFVEVGLLLLVIPWSSFWERNSLLEALPVLHVATRNPFLRGAISGLGVLNLGAGVAELWSGVATWRRARLSVAGAAGAGSRQ
jgi:hypothetical protein